MAATVSKNTYDYAFPYYVKNSTGANIASFVTKKEADAYASAYVEPVSAAKAAEEARLKTASEKLAHQWMDRVCPDRHVGGRGFFNLSEVKAMIAIAREVIVEREAK